MPSEIAPPGGSQEPHAASLAPSPPTPLQIAPPGRSQEVVEDVSGPLPLEAILGRGHDSADPAREQKRATAGQQRQGDLDGGAGEGVSEWTDRVVSGFGLGEVGKGWGR
jgi:hypothetical protein